MEWTKIFENSKLIEEVFVITITAGGLVWGGYKFFWGKTHAICLRFFNALACIERIQSEFNTNGGASLKDALNRIENKLLYLEYGRRLQIASASYGVSQCDQYGRVVDVNRKFYEMAGLAKDDCIGHNWLVSVKDDKDREAIKKAIHEAIMDKREVFVDFELNKLKVTQHYSPIINKKDMIEGFMVSTEQASL